MPILGLVSKSYVEKHFLFFNAKEGLTSAYEIGEYWDKNTQIDLVGYREDGWTDLGECKWGELRAPKRILKELEEKVNKYPNQRNATVGRRIFSRKPIRPPKDSTSEIRWHCLDDLYSK